MGKKCPTCRGVQHCTSTPDKCGDGADRTTADIINTECPSVQFLPHKYFKTKSITTRGARDSRGRFVKPTVTLKECPQEQAEYAAGLIACQSGLVNAALVRTKRSQHAGNHSTD